jgi:hypothetical protein
MTSSVSIEKKGYISEKANMEYSGTSLLRDWWWFMWPRRFHTDNGPKKLQLSKPTCTDHSLESSWGPLSDGTISFFIHFLCIFWIFLKSPELRKGHHWDCQLAWLVSLIERCPDYRGQNE